MAGAVALGFTLTSASAADIATSPRLRQQLDERKTVASTGGPNTVSNTYLGAAAKWELNRARVVPSGTVTPNLVSGNYLGTGAKNPYPKSASFQIAPLVGKDKSGKTCEPGCTKACCAKK